MNLNLLRISIHFTNLMTMIVESNVLCVVQIYLGACRVNSNQIVEICFSRFHLQSDAKSLNNFSSVWSQIVQTNNILLLEKENKYHNFESFLYLIFFYILLLFLIKFWFLINKILLKIL